MTSTASAGSGSPPWPRSTPTGLMEVFEATDAGLVVSPRIRSTSSIPVRVPVSVDPFGNVTEWVEVDREVAGMWDERVWRDRPSRL